ncbi:MAG: SpoIIE family protein phosphatase [Elusimicrobia bacterium]|nr:SpoIIE family protein phosphatase [Elusimicrobiota bacterium]
MRDKSIAFKLIVLVCATSTVVFAVVFGFFYRFTSRLMLQDTERYARQLTMSTVHQVRSILGPIQKVPEGLADYLDDAPVGQETMQRLLKQAAQTNPDIYGFWIAFAPHAFDQKHLYFCPAYHRMNGKLRYAVLGSPTYQYFYEDFFQIPKELGRPAWSEPYFDVGGGDILMTSYSVPFYRRVAGERRFVGVVGVDISLDWLTKLVSSIKVLRTGDAFLISQNGTFVTHHRKQLIMNETIFSLAEGRGDPVLREIGRRMIGGEMGFRPYRRVGTDEPAHMFFAPIGIAGWSLGVVFPDRELLSDLRRLSWITVLVGTGALLILVLFVASECRSVTQPLTAMARATEAMAGGNLDVDLPQALSRDEVGQLTDSFRRMRDSLKDYIRKLTETTAAKQRIESELSIARDIQMSTLPKIFPPLPDFPEIEMHAVLDPAREVGGDLYDFYLMEGGQFCFTIGDVSGKGVPASLFLAITKTLLKSVAGATLSPAAILARVNDNLSEGNDQMMFVTTFFAVLDIKTGMLRYSNGGHNPPLLLRRGEEMSFLEGGHGTAVGVRPGAAYEEATLTLRPGDGLFLYTDGVTEGMAPDGSFFGEERMLEYLKQARELPPKDMVLGLLKDVDRFSQGDHADDITLLALRYLGPGCGRPTKIGE